LPSNFPSLLLLARKSKAIKRRDEEENKIGERKVEVVRGKRSKADKQKEIEQCLYL
jgi:hypothetical protein